MYQSDSIGKLATALKNFQAEVGNVPKDAINPFFKSKYASLENVIATVKPVLAKHGLSYTQFPSFEGLTTTLMHESGEWVSADAKLIVKDQTPQGQGSAITYMRRYALSAVLGIATEDDDDGNAATAPAKVAQPGKPAPKPVEKPVTKTAAPKSVVEQQQSKEIKALVDAKVLQPFAGTKEELAEKYRTYVFEQTNLLLVPENFAAIIERLKAI